MASRVGWANRAERILCAGLIMLAPSGGRWMPLARLAETLGLREQDMDDLLNNLAKDAAGGGTGDIGRHLLHPFAVAREVRQSFLDRQANN